MFIVTEIILQLVYCTTSKAKKQEKTKTGNRWKQMTIRLMGVGVYGEKDFWKKYVLA